MPLFQKLPFLRNGSIYRNQLSLACCIRSLLERYRASPVTKNSLLCFKLPSSSSFLC